MASTGRKFVLDWGLFSGKVGTPLSLQAANILLRAQLVFNVLYLRNHPNTPPIYDSGVKYKREGTPWERWQTIPIMMQTKRGDCEDLAAWRAAELNIKGIKAFPIIKKNKLGSYHVVVKKLVHGKWKIEDPSKKLGMLKEMFRST